MTEPEVTDAEVVESTELVPSPPSPALFRTDDPVLVIEKATAVADALKAVLQKQKLTSTISGRTFVKVEGWTLLGSMLGVTAVCTGTQLVPEGFGATVEARMSDGRVVGSADALCTRKENSWKSRDDYALLSMAQTRATSKALRIPLGFVVTLAGYEATPAEEIPAEPAPAARPAPVDPEGVLEPERIAAMMDAIRKSGKDVQEVLDAAGIERVADTTNEQAKRVKELLA